MLLSSDESSGYIPHHTIGRTAMAQMTCELISTAVTNAENNAFLGSTEVFPSTKESLLIWPMSGPTGKTVLVAQRRRLGTGAACHTCEEN